MEVRDPMLIISDLHCSFGRTKALDGLSMQVPRGSVTAFVGANGAGKTTTFSILGGFLRRWKGTVLIDGVPLSHFRRAGGMLGLMPQDMEFFEARPIRRQLTLFARLSGLGPSAARKEADRVLDLVSLSDRAGALPRSLSHGMRVRLGIAQSLIASPSLVLLDEPTAGLDPQMVQEVRTIVDRVRGSTTLVISSHDLDVLESICDHLCIIEKGRVLQQGPLREVLGESSEVTVTFKGLGQKGADLALLLPESSVRELEPDVLSIIFDPSRVSTTQVSEAVMRWSLESGVPIVALETRRSLEQRYLEEVAKDRKRSEKP